MRAVGWISWENVHCLEVLFEDVCFFFVDFGRCVVEGQIWGAASASRSLQLVVDKPPEVLRICIFAELFDSVVVVLLIGAINVRFYFFVEFVDYFLNCCVVGSLVNLTQPPPETYLMYY